MVASHSYLVSKGSETGYTALLRNPAMRKRLAYGFYAMALQQFGGIAALTMLVPPFFLAIEYRHGRLRTLINTQRLLLTCRDVQVRNLDLQITRLGRWLPSLGN